MPSSFGVPRWSPGGRPYKLPYPATGEVLLKVLAILYSLKSDLRNLLGMLGCAHSGRQFGDSGQIKVEAVPLMEMFE